MAIASHIGVQVRAGRAEDTEHIVRIGREAWKATFGHSVTPEQLHTYFEEAYTIKAISHDIANPLKSTFVATDENGTVVGFALLTQGTTEPCLAEFRNFVELQRIYVDLTQHGRGIARLMSDRAEQAAKEMGFKHIWLGVWEENYRAQRVYEKLGYRLIGEHAFDVGGDIQNDFILIKDL